MPLPDAVAAPRLHHQALPDELYLERGGFVRPSVDSLEAMGHKVSVWGYKTEVNAIARTAAGWVGVADPRRGGGAAGYLVVRFTVRGLSSFSVTAAPFGSTM